MPRGLLGRLRNEKSPKDGIIEQENIATPANLGRLKHVTSGERYAYDLKVRPQGMW